MTTEKTDHMQTQYCIWCGSRIKKDSAFCTKCGKKQTDKENRLADWLIKHTKDKLKGDANSTLFDLIKNFLLSHLYGTVMSIAIVAAGAVTVYAGQPYITRYSGENVPPYMKDNTYAPPQQSTDYDRQTNDIVHNVCSEFMELENHIGQQYHDGGTVTVDHLLLPADFPYRHSFVIGPDSRFETGDGLSLTTILSKTVTQPSDFGLSSTLALANQGFDAAECTAVETVTDKNDNVIYRRESLFGCVILDGQRYIADRLIISVEDNSLKPAPAEIDSSRVKDFMTDYIYAVYSGGDLARYQFSLPDDFDISMRRSIHTLPDKMADCHRVDVTVENAREGSGIESALAVEKMGYKVIGANINVRVWESADTGRCMVSNHRIALVDDGTGYKYLDDEIGALAFEG